MDQHERQRMSFLAGLNEATTFSKHGYPGIGKFKCKIANVKYNTATFGGVPCYVVEYDILESTNPADPVGVRRAWVVKMAPKDMALSQIKGWVFAVGKAETDAEKAKINAQEVAEAAVTDAQPLKDATFRMEVRPYKNKAGKDTSITTFIPDR